MSASISQTETQALAVLRAFLMAMLPVGLEIVRGQTNRVPPPIGPNYIVLTPILRVRLSTNVSTYTTTPDAGSRHALSPMQVTVQVDVHGPAGAENAQIIATLLRDEAACRAFKAAGIDAQPLYAGDPRQAPFLNGEAQVETRWTLDAVLQVNTAVTVSQDFADTLITRSRSARAAP